ncbi:MAG: tetratricopeptide repeat protein [Pyrinomonadaceae bacterium]
MIYQRIKQSAYPLALIVSLLLLIHAGASAAQAKDEWVSVRSKNFFLLGNCGEKEVRRVATRLEQFREVFSKVLQGVNFNSPVPTTVVVFKNDSSFRPFKPNATTAGYFQSGADVNYIALTAEDRGEQDPFTVIYHEYVHLLVNNTFKNAPTWFNEGLADYYSSFFITDDQKVTVGKPIASHVYLLREKKILPLRTLFAVDQDSPYYNERDKQSIFYAQSWALMHYLVLANGERRKPQLGTFLALLGQNVPVEEAFRKAFESTFEQMEKELRAYVQRDSYPVMNGHFKRKLELDTEMQSGRLSEAEAQAYLGDLLLHSRRADAETYLKKALALDPDQPMANTSMGMLHVYQGRFEEARTFLQRAVAADPKNYLAQYNYALALSREGMDSNNYIRGYKSETVTLMRASLRKAIELEPTFPESYSLLAFVNMIVGDSVDESVSLIKQALVLAPGKEEYSFTLAQLYLRKQDFKAARLILEPIAREGNKSEMRQHAKSLLDQVTSFEARMAPSGINTDPVLIPQSGPGTVTVTMEQITESSDPSSYLREALRVPHEGEKRLQAILVRIDCSAREIIITVREGEKLLKLSARDFSGIDITTYSPDISGEINCGPRKVENSVIVTYRPAKDPARSGGEMVALEFVPKDFKLK